jgi:hypothetical protein
VATKRQSALLALLFSERSYALDLALIRDTYIPAALGMFFAVHYPFLRIAGIGAVY